MLTKRQIEILLELSGKPGKYFKANQFSDKLNVSLRTIQNDLKAIKNELYSEIDILEIDSKVPFGTRIIVKNQTAFEKYIESLKTKTEETFLNYKDNRIHHLLLFLLNQRRSVTLNNCADIIYVSKSTLLNDLKNLEEILEQFSLHLIQSKGYVWIDGLERDKRMCLIDNDCGYVQIVPTATTADADTVNLEYMRKLLMDEFIKEQYSISDLDFQNLILWLNVSIKRIINFFYLNKEDIINEHEFATELRLAQKIFDRLEKHYLIRVPQTEINFLALYIKNHSNFSDSDYISAELNTFILEALQRIRASYPTDFTHDMDLRMSLALHCAPLISRAQNNIQIKNEMLDYVKQNFTYAFDIATYFSYLLSEKFNCKIKESETAFLAIYFNKSIQEHSILNGNKRICIITNLKRSEYFLIEQVFYDRFQKYISTIHFVNSTQLDDLDLDDYDLFFSTDDNRATEVGLASKITSFPDENELEKIKVRIEGFRNIEDILQLFDKRLFFQGESHLKDNIQNQMVSKATEYYNVKNLSEEIELREEFGSTYFGNGIAVLHPMHSTENDSFIGVYIPKKPVQWDRDGNQVNLIFLVCIAKNNLEAFHAWDYIAKMLFYNDFKQEVLSANSFEQFKNICENQLIRKVIK